VDTPTWLELNSKPWPLRLSHSTAHGTQVIRSLTTRAGRQLT